jgi:hypothetical protein
MSLVMTPTKDSSFWPQKIHRYHKNSYPARFILEEKSKPSSLKGNYLNTHITGKMQQNIKSLHQGFCNATIGPSLISSISFLFLGLPEGERK